MGPESEQQLMENHEVMLKAAFSFMGVRRLHVVRDQADLQQALALSTAE